MYSVIALTVLLSAVCFFIYYSKTFENEIILWVGIVSFMILYHFGLRILMGNVTKFFGVSREMSIFRQRSFEKKIFKLLRIREWKDKVLTFDPASFDFKNRTLSQLADTMARSELDHWINEIISVVSIFFFLIWGCFPAFFITAVAAMIFDAQFILVQRYNRPIVLRLMERREKRTAGRS